MTFYRTLSLSFLNLPLRCFCIVNKQSFIVLILIYITEDTRIKKQRKKRKILSDRTFVTFAACACARREWSFVMFFVSNLRSKDPFPSSRSFEKHRSTRRSIFACSNRSLSPCISRDIFLRIQSKTKNPTGKIEETGSNDMRYSGPQKIDTISALHIRGLDLLLE